MDTIINPCSQRPAESHATE